MRAASYLALTASVAFACGARSAPPASLSHEDAPEVEKRDAGASVARSDPEQPARPADVADSGAFDGAVGDGGLTCADVGKRPGLNDCCNGQYCTGLCVDGICRCGNVTGGCIQPLCCRGRKEGFNRSCGGCEW